MTTTCPIPNIGPAQRRRRRLGGAVSLAAAGLTWATFLALGGPTPAALVTVGVLLLLGFLGVLQAKDGT